jgi:murein DD-endopeptidase MepM/ murein hydrolase activator NlpD
VYFNYFSCVEMRCYFKLVGLVITCLCMSLSPAFAQTCSYNYANATNEDSADESPVQRVGTVRSGRDLALHWTKPTDFTEILPFSGAAYQLAEHEGIDFINSDRTVNKVAVRSVANGKVVYIANGCPQSNLFAENTEQRHCGGDWGNHVVLLHPNGLFTRYAHLHPDSIQVHVGQRVQKGETLAQMGNTGRSDTRHLHFELGVAIKLDPCKSPQSFEYIYDPVIHLGWADLLL